MQANKNLYVKKIAQNHDCRHDCQMNFIKEYVRVSYDDDYNRLSYKRKGDMEQYAQFPLWLYEISNAVKTTLPKERIKLHDELKSLMTVAKVMLSPMESLQGHWDEHAILKFLTQVPCCWCAHPRNLSFPNAVIFVFNSTRASSGLRPI
jgi:hypothetical protein